MDEPFVPIDCWKITRESADSEIDSVLISVSNSSDEADTEICRKMYVHPPQSVISGTTYPSTVTLQRWQLLNSSVQYRASDILVVSYPKSGTTLIEQCVLLILNGGKKCELCPANKNVYSPTASEKGGKIWLEACIDQDMKAIKKGDEFRPITFAEFIAAPSPRLIKSHAPSKLLLGMTSDESMPQGLKMIVMSRNPFDSCVSRYYHAFNPHASGWSFSAWAAVWLSGNTAYGSWFEWVRDWNTRAQKHREQILWIQYEEMIQDPKTQIRNIIDFLGVSDGCDIPALIERVADGCSFDSMKRHANEGTSTDFQGHLRKGVKGDWVNQFSEDIECAFIRKYHEELGGSGLVYDFGANLGIVRAGAPNDASKLSKSMPS